ncbi:MAG: radical SAM protein [Nanoarchaeota archaeon]|nr:radical SAM protein [Nanoarchaeota archaeon]
MVLIQEEEISVFSKKYQLSNSEILLIALNLNGVNSKQVKNPNVTRVRFSMKPEGDEDTYFLAVSLTKNTPFTYEKGVIKFYGKEIGKAGELQEDTCDSTYFRMGKNALTLNSNSRGNCRGCRFCGTYTLDVSPEEDLTNPENMRRKIGEIKKEGNLKDLSNMKNVGIVTGCFKDEETTLNHLIMVRKIFSEYGFKGEIVYIGSQIRSEESLDKLSKIGPFALYLTVECFERREKMMKPVKSSLTLEKGRDVLRMAKKKGIQTSFLYILGLDTLKSIKEEFPKYMGLITRHPVINLLQNYKEGDDELRAKGAQDFEYYLKARRKVEKIFAKTKMRPRIWENYRAPWSKTYNGEKLNGPKI